MYVLPNCFRFRYACMFVLNILDAFWRKHVHYIFILFFLGNVISMVYLDFFSLYSPHAAMWFWCNISSRGFFGYQFFMEEPFWWMARGLQIGLWVVYGHVDFSSEGTRHDYGLMIIIIIIFFNNCISSFKKALFWVTERTEEKMGWKKSRRNFQGSEESWWIWSGDKTAAFLFTWSNSCHITKGKSFPTYVVAVYVDLLWYFCQ